MVIIEQSERPHRNPEGDLWMWIVGGVAALLGLGYLATRRQAQAGGPTLAPLPSPGAGAGGSNVLQSFPLPSGWYTDEGESTDVGSIERAQIAALGYACDTVDACAASMRTLASGFGLPDPLTTGANESDATTFAQELDAKYRLRFGLPAASAGLFSAARYAR